MRIKPEKMTQFAMDRSNRMEIEYDGNVVWFRVLLPRSTKRTNPIYKTKSGFSRVTMLMHKIRSKYQVPLMNISIIGFDREMADRYEMSFAWKEDDKA